MDDGSKELTSRKQQLKDEILKALSQIDDEPTKPFVKEAPHEKMRI